MPAIARRHHVLSQGYLACFTDTGTQAGKLFVCDLRTKHSFLTSPKNVCVERDFNLMSDETQEPDRVEKALSGLESAAIPILRRMCAVNAFPPDDDFSYVLNLMCLLVVHNPRARRRMNTARQHSTRMMLDMLASSRALYETQLRRAREAGFVTGPGVPFERFQKFASSGRFRIEITTDASLGTEFGIFDAVLCLLGRRSWSLLVTAKDAPDFMCSDHPVTLAYKDSSARGSIGFGIRNTEVMFPLDPRHALFGVFEDPLPLCVELSPERVEELNLRTICQADRQVFGRPAHQAGQGSE